MKKALIFLIIMSLLSCPLTISASLMLPQSNNYILVDDILPDTYTIPYYEQSILSEDAQSEIVTISTAKELIDFRDKVNSDSEYSKNKIFKLTGNIDLGGIEWTPVGYNSSFHPGDNNNKLRDFAFQGIFDGQGNTISNFKITNESTSYLGFFGTLHLSTVKNLNLADVIIDYNGTSSSELPPFSGILTAFSNHAIISDCNVSGSISITNTNIYEPGMNVAVGMISGVGLAKVDNCTAYGSIYTNTLNSPYVGGIWGLATKTENKYESYINNCSSDVTLQVESISEICTGGIIGRTSDSLDSITNCSYSLLSDSSIATYQKCGNENLNAGSVFTGGIAGTNYSLIKDCSVGDTEIFSSVETYPVAGGIAGQNHLYIENCSSLADLKIILNKGELKSPGSPHIGGITGINAASHKSSSDPAPAGVIPTIKDCIITEDVSIDISSQSSASSACGFIAGTSYAPSEILYCASYSSDMTVSSTSGGLYAGGICGLLSGGAIRYCGASGAIGENLSTGSSMYMYLGGIAGTADMKYFFSYDDRFGIISPSFTIADFYGAIIEDCVSEVDLSIKNINRLCLGGICGQMAKGYNEDGTVYYITPTREIGISRCVAFGDITFTPGSSAYVGGALGYSVDGHIYDSHSTGDICITADASSSFVGGFMGAVYQNSHDNTDVTATTNNCYTTSTIIIPDACSKLIYGGFVGFSAPSAYTRVMPGFTSCYYLNGIEQKKYNGISAISLEDSSKPASFTGWNFDEIWDMSGNIPALYFETTGIYKHTQTNETLDSVLISQLNSDSIVFAVTYENEKIIDTRVFENNKELTNRFFRNVECNIELSDNTVTVFYIWGGEHGMMPLCDTYIF